MNLSLAATSNPRAQLRDVYQKTAIHPRMRLTP